IQSNGICAAPRGILDASMPMVVSVNRRSSQVAQAFAGTGLDAQPRWHLARDALAIDAPVQGLRQAVGAEREQAESRDGEQHAAVRLILDRHQRAGETCGLARI